MQGVFKYILIFVVGFALGYEFTSQGSRVSSSIEAGMISRSELNKQFEQIISPQKESLEKEIKVAKSYEQNRPMEQKVDLSSYSFHELSKALDEKHKQFRNENIKKYEVSDEESERKKRDEDVLSILYDTLAISSFWMAETRISLGEKEIPFLVITNFYSGGNFEDGVDLEKLEDSSICWLTTLYFEHNGEKQRVGTSDCTPRVYKNNKYYMTLETLGLPGMNDLMNYMLIPLPSYQGIESEYLIPNDKTWYKGTPLSWNSVSKVEAEKIRDGRSDYKWIH